MKQVYYFVVLLMSFSLSACTSVFGDVRATFDYALSSPEDVQLSATEVAEFPYTAQYASWDDMAQILIVLGFIDGHTFHWITGERETLVTEYGRVTRTAMLEHELISLSNKDNDPLRCVLEQACESSWTREGSFIDSAGRTYSRTIVSDFSIEGGEEIQLPTGQRSVTKVIEEGAFVLADHKQYFKNTFWLESDGHVVKSHQYLTPGRPGLTLTQVKWVGRDEQ